MSTTAGNASAKRGEGSDARLSLRMAAYLRPYRSAVAVTVLLLVALAALQAAGPYLIKVGIDDYIGKGDLQGLDGLALLYLLVLLGQYCVSFAQTYLMNWTGQRVMYDLRLEIFAHIQKLHMSYFDRAPLGRTMTRVTSDVDALNELFTSGVVTALKDMLSLAGIVTAMLWIDWRLALVSFAVIPLLAAATIVFKRKVRDVFRRIRTCVSKINAFLQENVTGMSTVQMFVQEERKFDEFKERNREHRDAYIDSIRYYAVFYPVVTWIGSLAIALILWYGGLQVMRDAVTLGAVVAFIQYSRNFFRPISDLSEKFAILQGAMAASERIFDLLDRRPEISTPARPLGTAPALGRIEFRNVDFEYVAEAPVLHDVSFTVEAGEQVAIVGATGSGKSTLIGLVSRFYEVGRGQVLVDGVDVRDWELGALRRSMSVVLQDAFLFRGTIEENIRLWDGAVSGEQAQQAARQVHAEEFVNRLPLGYQTQVAEGGSSLSGGQKQLLSFARALARDPRILILDEATSSVDSRTEGLIQDALSRLLQGRTSMIVAHRLSTIRNADRIIVLHKGRIQEQGTHSQLLARRGTYFKLYQLQHSRLHAASDPERPAGELGGIRR